MDHVNTLSWNEFASKIARLLMYAEDRTHITLIQTTENVHNSKYIEYTIMNGTVSCSLENEENPQFTSITAITITFPNNASMNLLQSPPITMAGMKAMSSL